MSLIAFSACGGTPRAPASGMRPDVAAIPPNPEPPDPEPPDPEPPRPHPPRPRPPDPEPPRPDPPEPLTLARPPFDHFVAGGARAPATAGGELVVVSRQRNQITDDDRWFRTHDLVLPMEQVPSGPRGAEAPTYRGVPRAAIFAGSAAADRDGRDSLRLHLYQHPLRAESYLLGVDPASGRTRFAFDFSAYAMPPSAPDQAQDSLVRMELEWAIADRDRLYVSHAHRTYASTSGGANAYITALRIPDGALLWRSRPLVSNARNFALVRDPRGDVLVTGYGFTAEPDFLYLLDPDSGAVIDRTALRTGPTYIIPKGDIIHVRTYDHDYQVRLKRTPPARQEPLRPAARAR